MIAHVSIPAENPQKVAILLGKITSSRVFHFPVVDGAFIVVSNDNSGAAIEVYPAGMSHHPGRGDTPSGPTPVSIKTQPWEDQIFMEKYQRSPSSHHLAISTNLSEREIVELGRSLDFRTMVCDRAGVFKLVELWIDNTFLIEVLTAPETQRYKNFMNPVTVSKMFGEPIDSHSHSSGAGKL